MKELSEGKHWTTASLWKLFYTDIEPEFRTRDLPERFGDFRVVHTRFSRWRHSGVWERVFQAKAEDADNEYARN
ncbi:hypothetical protein CYANOKiyG1_03190 [Okeania sp. KiyG1]|nr:hypothetical protein CYANOKiyG1_03190 [Okeania sp. KiyG1]